MVEVSYFFYLLSCFCIGWVIGDILMTIGKIINVIISHWRQ